MTHAAAPVTVWLQGGDTRYLGLRCAACGGELADKGKGWCHVVYHRRVPVQVLGVARIVGGRAI